MCKLEKRGFLEKRKLAYKNEFKIAKSLMYDNYYNKHMIKVVQSITNKNFLSYILIKCLSSNIQIYNWIYRRETDEEELDYEKRLEETMKNTFLNKFVGKGLQEQD